MSRSGVDAQVPAPVGPIDWQHLDRVTMGDAALADEVLGLFDRQAGEMAEAIRVVPPDMARLLHGLKGSACGIGAVQVADAAQRLEAKWENPDATTEALVTKLIAAIACARAAIAQKLK